MVDAIIQARVGSTRLPRKVLELINGQPLIFYVIKKIKLAKNIKNIILAIPDTKENDILEKFAKENNINYFRGIEDDVLSRFYHAAKKFGSKDVLRICADSPLIDPEVIDFTIDKYYESGVDYISTRIKHTFPEGMTVEIFKFDVLEKIFIEAKEPNHREHVTPYIYANPDKFKIGSIENIEDLSYMRWTVDNKEDLDFIKEVLKNKDFLNFRQISEFLKEHPEITKINSNIHQNILAEQNKKNFAVKFIFE